VDPNTDVGIEGCGGFGVGAGIGAVAKRDEKRQLSDRSAEKGMLKVRADGQGVKK
jgi:hypothetical protein